LGALAHSRDFYPPPESAVRLRQVEIDVFGATSIAASQRAAKPEPGP